MRCSSGILLQLLCVEIVAFRLLFDCGAKANSNLREKWSIEM